MRDRPELLDVPPGPLFAPPFTLDDARTTFFALRADRDKLDALLARTFAWAEPELTVRAAAPLVLLVFTDMGRARCANEGLGWERYREVSFFVPVTGTRDGVGFTAMHVPFIYPDSARAMNSGRELYGLPKKHAHAISLASPLALDVVGTEQFDGGEWRPARLITVDTDERESSEAPHDGALHALIAHGLDRSIASLSALFSLNVLQLHQPPDTDPGRWPLWARTRGILSAPTRIRGLRDARILDAERTRITVASPASDPIRDTLGLGDGALRPLLALRFTMDFTLDAAERWVSLPDGLPTPRKKRVLILGGGMGALAAALALTDTEDRRARFDVRVLVQGHRLGGKGASWRSDDAYARIEEHGIHVIFGFYHNFLRAMRGVFAECARPDGVFPSRFDEAFSARYDLAFFDGTRTLRVELPKMPSAWGTRAPTVAEMVEAVRAIVPQALSRAGALWRAIKALFSTSDDPAKALSFEEQLTEFAEVFARGVTEIALDLHRSFDDYDGEDFRAWMRGHGASDALLAGAVMQVPYDAVFAYEGGDTSRPALAAGMAIRGLLRLALFYENAPYFVMQSGMGECVFAPLYEVLTRRGVRFEFFSKVTALSMQGNVAHEVTVVRQAKLSGARYEPLTHTRSTPCWSLYPDAAQLASPAPHEVYSDASASEVSRDVLRSGEHFDHVVCALPAPVTARVLVNAEADPWLSGIAKIPTVATMQLQTWHARTLSALGWAPGAHAVGGFSQPLNTLLDASVVLPREAWADDARPLGLLYACGPLADGAKAETVAREFVAKRYKTLLPHENDALQRAFFRANTDLSERYVLCAPGGLVNRPRPTDAEHPNLSLAGDWVRTGVDIPCMEGATVSGLRVAEALTGEDLNVLADRDFI